MVKDWVTETQLGRFIADLRMRRDYSQVRAAQMARIARSTLIRWETGQTMPQIPELMALLKALGASERDTETAIGMIHEPRAENFLNQKKESIAREHHMGSVPHGGQLVRAARISRGLTLEEVGEAVGVSARTIGRWENNKLQPSQDHLSRLLRVFGREFDYENPALNKCLGQTVTEANLEEEFARYEEWSGKQFNPLEFWEWETRFIHYSLLFWDLAVTNMRAREILGSVLGDRCHINYIAGNKRAAAKYAEQSLEMLENVGSKRVEPYRQVITLARVNGDSRGYARAKASFKLIEDALPTISDKVGRNWMKGEASHYLSEIGAHQHSIKLAAESVRDAEEVGLEDDIDYRRIDLAKANLRANQPYQALQAVSDTKLHDGKFLTTEWELIQVRCLIQCGEGSQAATKLTDISGAVESQGLNWFKPTISELELLL